MNKDDKRLHKTKIHSTLVNRNNVGNPIQGESFGVCAREIAIHQALSYEYIGEVYQLLREMHGEDVWFDYTDGVLVPRSVGADSKPKEQSKRSKVPRYIGRRRLLPARA